MTTDLSRMYTSVNDRLPDIPGESITTIPGSLYTYDDAKTPQIPGGHITSVLASQYARKVHQLNTYE